MFRHACTSRLIVNDELYTQAMDLFLMVDREAEARPTTHCLLAAQASMFTNEYPYSGSRGCQQSSLVKSISHACPSRGARVTQKRGGCSGRTNSKWQAIQGVRLVGGAHFFWTLYQPYICKHCFPGSMSPPYEHLESQDFRQPPGRCSSADTANSFCGSVSCHGPGVTLVSGTSGAVCYGASCQ